MAEQAINVTKALSLHLKFHHATLLEWVKADNWVVQVSHRADCPIELGTEAAECTCTPVTKMIWNGDPDFITKSHAVLGQLERAMAPATTDEASSTTTSPS